MTATAQPTDETARMGEPVEPTFRDSFPDLYGRARTVAQRILRDPALAEDAAQETMVRAYERWHRVLDHPSPIGWVLDTAWKVSMEMARRRNRLLPTSFFVPLTVSLDESALSRPALVAAIRALTERQRRVFLTRYLFSHDVSETASLLGMSPQQVKDASREARGRLRSTLEPFEEDLLS
jgi:RNA polymerase sigma factor (sigma-70 family)